MASPARCHRKNDAGDDDSHIYKVLFCLSTIYRHHELLNAIKRQYHTIDEQLPDYDRNFSTILGGATSPSDDDYEDPELQMLEGCQPVKILPARPIKESEYADTRYFQGVVDFPIDAKTSVPMEGRAWKTPARLVEGNKEDRPTSKDIRNQHITGDKFIKGTKIPLPPPRPLITLPKKYQPLPPEPDNSRSSFPQRHTFPETWRGSRQIRVTDFSEVLGAEKAPHHHMKPEQSHLPQNQNTQEATFAISSSSFMASNQSPQTRVHKGSLQPCSQPCQSPVNHTSSENKLTYKNMSWEKPGFRLDEKGVQHHDWYIGEHSRQAVEEALMKENKDGTFLVRDCSSKSSTEPYVLAVFHGRKVYNVKIRFLERNQQFALGTGLRGNEKFDSVEDIIEHYKYFPMTLIDGKDRTGSHREQCFLTQPLAPWPR